MEAKTLEISDYSHKLSLSENENEDLKHEKQALLTLMEKKNDSEVTIDSHIPDFRPSNSKKMMI